MKHLIALVFCLFLSLFLFTFAVKTVLAQDISAGVAIDLDIQDKNVQDGDIISFTPNGYKKSVVEYDTAVFGVVADVPAVAILDLNAPQQKQVVISGNVYVRVSSINGAIKNGDLLTTSKIAGVAQKASRDGFVIGNAQEDYRVSDPQKIGKILVAFNPGFNANPIAGRTNLLDNINFALRSPYITPVNLLRYILAALVAILSLVAGISFFGRVTSRGVEALGRNPLAGKMIILSIVINFILTLGIMSAGIAIAYLILVL